MAGYSAVSDVSRTLVNALKDGMVDPGPPEVALVERDEVGLASPDDAGDLSLRLTLYLYRVSENGHLKNAERQEIDVTRYKRPPLALDLYYLLTAHPATDGDNDQMDPHLVLGRAMQVLHDGSVLEGFDAEEEAYVSIYPQSMDEMANIWNTFQDESFQPSISYLVTPVLIESTEEETVQRVVERRIGQPQEDDGT